MSNEQKFRVEGQYGMQTMAVKFGSPVRSQWANIPDWFKGAAQRIQPDPDVWRSLQDDGEIAWDIIFSCHNHGWMDHDGWTGEGEKSQFVSEPYALEQSDVKDLIEFCNQHDFGFEILGKSRHYPSSTVRVSIFPRVVHPFVKYETPPEWLANVRAFQMKNRLIAADILEHFLYLVPADERQFFQHAIWTVCSFAKGESGYDPVQGFHDRAEKIHNTHNIADGLPYRSMLAALINLTQPEEPLSELDRFGLVQVYCLDAVEYSELGSDLLDKRGKRGQAYKWVEEKLDAAWAKEGVGA